MGFTPDAAVEVLLARVARERALPFSPPLSAEERASDPPAVPSQPGVRDLDVVLAFNVNERVADEARAALAALGLSVDRAVG